MRDVNSPDSLGVLGVRILFHEIEEKESKKTPFLSASRV